LPPARTLQQEHIVGIEVRTDTTARGRVTEHQIVEPGIRDEVEARQELAGGRQHLLEALQQQRPVARRQAGKSLALEGAMFHGPAIGAAHNQPRLAMIAAGQIDHVAEIEETAKAGQGAAHEQRLLLPVSAQKCRGRQAAEKPIVHCRHLIAAGVRAGDIVAFEIG